MSLRFIPRGSVLGALSLAVACSLVVPAELEEIRCSSEGTIGPPACDPGHVCAGGICRLCALTETCGDGFDNDCVGGIDNDCPGGDSGGASATGGGGSPGDSSAGSGGEPGGTGGISGSGGATGGASGGVGGASGGVGIGTPCPVGNECAQGDFCAKSEEFGLAAGQVCTRGCCSSDECGPGNVCYSTTGGNSLCFTSSMTGRTLGAAVVGDVCGGHGDCASGLCLDGICTDACCTNNDCPANIGACQAKNIGDRLAFVCALPGGEDYLFSCDDGDWITPNPVPEECDSRVCVWVNGYWPPYFCSKTCCRPGDCSGGLTCMYAALDTPTIKYCRMPAGEGQMGALCSGNQDCSSGLCVRPQVGDPFCSEACCQDSDCGSPGSFACRPGVLSGIAHLICVKL